MKLPISLKLALNYLRPNKSTVSIINIISTLGVLLGVAVLIIVLSIMNGFGQTWKEKILSVNAHINLLPSTKEVSSWKHTVDYVSTFKEVEYVMPIIDSFALMQLDNNIGTPILRGIDPNIKNPLIDNLRNSITEGIFSLKADEIILSSGLARKLNAKSDIGLQLDSLADLVSFGLVPGILLYNMFNAAPSSSVGSISSLVK